MQNSLYRWAGLLRGKAQEFEHSARKRGETVCSPSLDEIANEMLAFIDGVEMTNPKNNE